MQQSSPLLERVLPELANELRELLRRCGEEALASQILALHVKSRCNCGDDFCATIYTGAGKPNDSLDLEPMEGMLILDLDVDKQIIGIEILYRPDYKAAVDAVFASSTEERSR